MGNYSTVRARDELAKTLKIKLPSEIDKNERVIEGIINGEDCIIVCFAIVLRSPNQDKGYSEQRYVDLNSIGERTWTRIVEAWNQSISENKKIYFLAINHTDSFLKDYIFSLEFSPQDHGKNSIYISEEQKSAITAGITNIKRFVLSEETGFISIINKKKILDYMSYFDNRPYLINVSGLNGGNMMVEIPEFVEKITQEQKSVSSFPKNRLLTGAPGTGKSYRFSEDSEEFVEVDKKKALYSKEETDSLISQLTPELRKIVKPVLENAKLFSEIRRITFYPDYSYGSFVGCYKPIADKDDEIKYEFIEGPFIELLVKAIMNPYENYCLIIEEINRAKAASVFGDIFQLLDRDSSGKSEYYIKTPVELKDKLDVLLSDGKYYGNKWDQFKKAYIENMYIPHNLYIWATMNMADQGVFPMDSAFKRRWEFEFMPIDGDSKLEKKYLSYVVNMPVRTGQKGDHYILWNNFREQINNVLKGCGLEEDRLIGPYFMKPTASAELERVGTTEKGTYFVITKESLVNKLFSYLKQDILRYISSDKIFNTNLEQTGTMSSIRNAILIEERSIQDLFVFSDEAINAIDSVSFNVVPIETDVDKKSVKKAPQKRKTN